MKNKFIKYIPFLIVIISCVVVVILNDNLNKKNSEKVIIETNDRYMTLHNDGGTRTETKYEVDLQNKKVIKYGSSYIGFKGYEYKDKVIYTKELSRLELKKVKRIIEDIKQNQEEYSTDYKNSYMPYIFIQGDLKIELYDEKVISDIVEVLEK